MRDRKGIFFGIAKLFDKRRKSAKQSRKAKGAGLQSYAPLPEFASQPPSDRYIEKIFRLPLNEAKCTLSVVSMSGNVIISGYESDVVCMKVMYRPKNSDADIVFADDGSGQYSLNYGANDFDSVWAEAHVPVRAFAKIHMSTKNGKILVKNISTRQLHVSGQGCELKNVFANVLRVENTQNNLYLTSITSLHGDIDLSGGSLSAIGMDIKELSISVAEGSADIDAKYDRHDNYSWSVESKSSGMLDFNLPYGPSYYVLAQTRSGSVRMARRDMDILAGNALFIEAKNKGYDEALKKVNLQVEAPRGSIVIN